MAHVYILQSQSSRRFYVGSAVDLPRRLSEHQRHHSPFTRHGGPWELVYHEEFTDLAQARRRERRLKSWKSHREIKKLIESKKSG